ncbi:MAG: hypothetical protein AB9869_18800 [Verrucomicrobiia bacterium]
MPSFPSVQNNRRIKSLAPFFECARLFDQEIRAAGGKTVLFMAWPYERYWVSLEQIAQAHREISKELGVAVAPVGVAFSCWLLRSTLGPRHFVSGSQLRFFCASRKPWLVGLSFQVEATTDLTKPTWTPVSTNTLAGGSSYSSDPEWTKYPSRFYRVRAQ